jgi:hypothetical protein
VTDPGGVYNGAAYGVTEAIVVGLGHKRVASFPDASLSYTYYQGTTVLPGAPVHAGRYTVVAHYAGNLDYNAADSQPFPFSITQAALTVTAESASMTYGGSLPAVTVRYSGFVNGDSAASLTTAPTFSTVPASSHTGRYAIGVHGASDPDYTISYTDGVLTINPAALAVIADSESMIYGGSLPALTVRYSGFVNGDSAASLTTAPTLNTISAASHAGRYAITVRGAVDPDYSISYTPGVLAITPAPLTITADDNTVVVGTALPALTARYSGFVNGDTPASLTSLPALSTVATTVQPGTYAISVGGAADPDYTITFRSGKLTVVPSPLTAEVGFLISSASITTPYTPGVLQGVAGLPSASPFLAGGQAVMQGITVLPIGGGGGGNGLSSPPNPESDPNSDQSPPQVQVAESNSHRATSMAQREGRPQRQVGEDYSGGAVVWEEEAERAEQDALFVALGARGIYHERDLFEELFIETAKQEEPLVFSGAETGTEMDPFTTTLTWFVLANVACELEAGALARR